MWITTSDNKGLKGLGYRSFRDLGFRDRVLGLGLGLREFGVAGLGALRVECIMAFGEGLEAPGLLPLVSR